MPGPGGGPRGGGFGGRGPGGPFGRGPGGPGRHFGGPGMGWGPRPPYGRPPRRPYYGGCFPWGCGCCLPVIGILLLGVFLFAFLL